MRTGSSVVVAALLFAFASGIGEAKAQDHEHGDVDVASVAPFLGVDPGRSPPKLTGEQERYARDIAKGLVCLCGTCPRVALDECTCGWAHRSRSFIQMALLDGKTREQIQEAYRGAYGLKVLPAPPDEGLLGKLPYVLPYAAAALGLAGVFWAGLRLRARASTRDPAGPPLDDEARALLSKELEELD